MTPPRAVVHFPRLQTTFGSSSGLICVKAVLSEGTDGHSYPDGGLTQMGVNSLTQLLGGLCYSETTILYDYIILPEMTPHELDAFHRSTQPRHFIWLSILDQRYGVL